MGYRCGIGGLGPADREPALFCNDCGITRPVTKPSGQPYGWFLDRKKAPGWAMDGATAMRRDYCGECAARRREREGR